MTMIERKLTVASVAATAQSCRIALFDLTRVKVPRNNISVTNRQGRTKAQHSADNYWFRHGQEELSPNAFMDPLLRLRRRSIRAQYTKVAIPKNRYGMRSLAIFFLNESRNCLSWNNMPEMMKNNGIWNEKIQCTSPANCDVCPNTTSRMPKPRSELSAVSLEDCAMT